MSSSARAALRRRAGTGAVLLLVLPAAAALASGPTPAEVRVGSKSFTEGVILGHILVDLASSSGARAVQLSAIGGTRVLWDALVRGDIDAYVEYTGTLRHEIFAGRDVSGADRLAAALGRVEVAASAPLGFENTYALAMPAAEAERLGIRSISDLRRHPGLRFALSNEFLARGDGWPGLAGRYGLAREHVRGLDHDLAYRALVHGAADVTDAYTTDPEIEAYDLRLLTDDLGYFPEYRAVVLYRRDLARRAPGALAAMLRLAGTIDARRMRRMNAEVKLDRIPATEVAARFVTTRLGIAVEAPSRRIAREVLRYTAEHLALVGISLGAAIVVAIPLGVLAFESARVGQVVLGLLGVVQTVPSLALLVFMIPLLGIGARPAIAALFAYSLLPITRNTYQGLHDVGPDLRESAEALGLPPAVRLWRIELPLASRAILAGIKTSAVINVGTATLGALIGAGGYGQPILTGIRLDDLGLIMEGAVPAALLALAIQAAFELLERVVVPRGLRLARE